MGWLTSPPNPYTESVQTVTETEYYVGGSPPARTPYRHKTHTVTVSVYKAMTEGCATALQASLNAGSNPPSHVVVALACRDSDAGNYSVRCTVDDYSAWIYD